MSAESDPVPAPGNNFWSATKRGMTVEECENMIQRSLRNPTVKFLREHLEKSGCKIAPNFIKAVNCKQQIAGCYVRGKGECVRRRVMKALASNPYCSKAAAKDAMEVVWNTCYNDTKPFDRAP